MADDERPGKTPEPKWEPIEKQRAYQQVLMQIEQQILAGVYRPGDRLPGERELSDMLDASRASVREALRILEALEIIVSRPGTGEHSGSIFVDKSPSNVLTRLLSLHVSLANFSLDDLVETRILMESWLARIAAEKATDDDTGALSALIEGMRDTRTDYKRFNELDADFHVGIARCADNALMNLLMTSIRDVMRQEMTAAFAEFSEWREVANALCEEHEQILQAIRHRDGERAAKTVETHIRNFYHGTLRNAREGEAGQK